MSRVLTTGGAVTVDWIRMSPYGSPCSFESRLFDAGGSFLRRKRIA
mgnify:CR=1 FL=1